MSSFEGKCHRQKFRGKINKQVTMMCFTPIWRYMLLRFGVKSKILHCHLFFHFSAQKQLQFEL